jgi:hypothetical protein
MMEKKNKPLLAPVITYTSAGERGLRLNISLSKYTSSTLLTCLQKALEGEEYEEAIIYRDELRKRVQSAA